MKFWLVFGVVVGYDRGVLGRLSSGTVHTWFRVCCLRSIRLALVWYFLSSGSCDHCGTTPCSLQSIRNGSGVTAVEPCTTSVAAWASFRFAQVRHQVVMHRPVQVFFVVCSSDLIYRVAGSYALKR